MNKEIVDFYLDISHNGHPKINDVLNSNLEWLESCHTWCQRAFPNYEPSEIVPGSPVLDDETLEWIKNYKMDKVHELVFKFLFHYKEVFIWKPSSIYHNNRRVTRLIKFLVMLESYHAVMVVLEYCRGILERLVEETIVSESVYHNTLSFWNEAAYNYSDDTEQE